MKKDRETGMNREEYWKNGLWKKRNE